MAPVTSAALLVHRESGLGLEVFLGHMGGPFWSSKDAGAWSIPKGLYDPAQEDAVVAARREFAEEIGIEPPSGPVIDLGEFVQPSRKRIRAFAIAGPQVRFVASNTFRMHWPPGSGNLESFPEIDRAQWFDLPRARAVIMPGQVPILDALRESLRAAT
jgi:predicted NUDIX family NTP pyrophosphohydrolase